MRQLTRALLFAALVAPAFTAAAQPEFQPGDVYFITEGYDGGNGFLPSIVRFEPDNGWQQSLVGQYNYIWHTGGYDPHRDRLIVKESVLGWVWIDADGNTTPLNHGWAQDPDFASAASDGRIFFFDRDSFHVVVSNGDGTYVHLQDQAGVTFKFQLFFANTDIFYHESSNQLFFFGSGAALNVAAVPLSADGTSISGPIRTMTIDATSGWDVGAGVGYGPNDQLMLHIYAMTSDPGARVQLLDPVSMVSQGYAWPDFAATAGVFGGAYVPFADAAVVYEFSLIGDGRMLLYPQGSSGEGAVLASELGRVSSFVRLITIPEIDCAADFNGDGTDNTIDVIDFLVAWSAGDPSADVNGNTVINTIDVIDFLSLWTAGC